MEPGPWRHGFAGRLFWRPAISLALLIACPACILAQGRLDAFESDAGAQPQDRPAADFSSKSGHYHGEDQAFDRDDSFHSVFGDVLVEGLRLVAMGGGICSWKRICRSSDSEWSVQARRPGEPLLPFARIDLAGQAVESDITAFDLRVEEGYGPFAAHLNWTRFTEATPADNLDVVRILALYRMSIGSHMGIDAGCGAISLDGDQHTTRFALTLPVLVHPLENWGIEFRPTWADRITDYDAAIMLTWEYFSLKAGYRWLHTPNESLDGPYMGISLRL